MKKGEDLILVMGATGQQGGAVAGVLLSAGHKVRAMTRNTTSDAARALAEAGAEVVQGNFDDGDSVKAAMDGAWGVFAVQNSWEAGIEGEETQGKNVAQWAKDTGIQHYVYTSVGSAHRNTGIPHFDNKWRVEETIRGLGLPSFTILRPVFFMENFTSPFFKPGIDEGAVTVGIGAETKLQMIAAADIGQYGRVAFERHEDLSGRAIDIAGDELTMPEAARMISSAAGREISFQPTPIDQVRQFSDDFATMLEWFDNSGYEADVEGNANEFGIAPTQFADWANAISW